MTAADSLTYVKRLAILAQFLASGITPVATSASVTDLEKQYYEALLAGTISAGIKVAEKGNFASSTAYKAGDIVTNNTIRYICNADHTSAASFAADSSYWIALDTGTAVPLAVAGQEPIPSIITATVGSGVAAARSDHAHPSFGLFALFNRGTDGNGVCDGTNAVTSLSRSGSIYGLTRDAYFDNLTVNAGVTLHTNGCILYVRGTLINNGTITVQATSGLFTGGGASIRWVHLGRGAAGGLGGTTVGGVGSDTQFPANSIGGIGASGGAGASGAGGGPGSMNESGYQAGVPKSLLGSYDRAFWGVGAMWDSSNINQNKFSGIMGGSGGGGGGGDGTNSGGAGGAGGATAIVNAKILQGSGTFTAPGGNGTAATTGNCGGGGGGGGGGIIVNTLDSSGWTGTFSAPGGTGGAGVGTGAAGGNGTVGTAVLQVWQ